jgi:hypothetical protein
MKRKYLAWGIVCVVVAGLGLLIYPAVSGARLMAQTIRLGSNGRQIHLGIFDKALRSDALTHGAKAETNKPTFWPVAGQYKTSTEFFKTVVSDEWLTGLDFSFFGGPGLRAPKDPVPPEGFRDVNNAWGVVTLATKDKAEEASILHKDTPFLFTKNIGFGDPPGPPWEGATVADMSGLIPRVKPFGKRAGVIITYGGSVKVLPSKHANQANFNPQRAKLKVLMP